MATKSDNSETMLDELTRDLTGLKVSHTEETEYNKLKSVIDDSLENVQNKKQGEEIYSGWAVNNYKWSKEDYENKGFQAVYTQKLFKRRAKLVKKALTKAVEQKYLDQEFLKSVKTVASFGCGPGPDLIGFKAYMQDEMKQNTSGITLTGYDDVDWGAYHDELETKFQECFINQTFIKDMPKSDVLLMSYFASSANFSDRNPDGSSNWDIVLQKAELVLVLDIKDPHQMSSLSKRDFLQLVIEDRGRDVYVHVK